MSLASDLCCDCGHTRREHCDDDACQCPCPCTHCDLKDGQAYNACPCVRFVEPNEVPDAAKVT